MPYRLRYGLVLVLCAGFFLAVAVVPCLRAEQSNEAIPQSAKTRKKLERKAKKEMGSAYWDWLNDDVPDIMTDPERKAFLELGTNEERDQFIESFWQRRNPDPDSLENTFKDEHYRRIAYANEHFSSGIPGRKTDRGRIYIIWGPPDEIDAHPTGGTYDRPMSEGGGSTTTYPWELWRYRHLEGIGENIELEFVDPSGSGEYHLTRDPGEKDALAHVPGAGLSLSEILNLSIKASRFSNPDGTTLPAPIGGRPAGMSEFDSLDQYVRIMRPPEHLKELTSFVSSRLITNQLHLDYSTDFFRITSDSVLVPITVQIPNREMGFHDSQGVKSAVLNLYARISTPTGRVVQTFEDTIARDVPDSLFQATLNQPSIYQKAVPLRPGLYRLDVVVKDIETGNVGVIGTALRVPRYEETKLDASSLVLADLITPVSSRQFGLGPFILGAYKVRPRLSGEFASSEKLGIYLQLYNLIPDATSHKANFSILYRILKNQQEIWHSEETSDSLHQVGEQITLGRMIPLSALAPGRYILEFTATDKVAHGSLTRSVEFTVAPEPARK